MNLNIAIQIKLIRIYVSTISNSLSNKTQQKENRVITDSEKERKKRKGAGSDGRRREEGKERKERLRVETSI